MACRTWQWGLRKLAGNKEKLLRWGAIVFASIGGADGMANPLIEAEVRFRELTTYQVTLRSEAADGERQVIRYSYSKPGWVRMEFVQPYRGMVLIYDPVARRVHLWPFGVKHSPSLTLAPDNPLIRNRRGHRVDRSDVGALITNLFTLCDQGKVSLLGGAEVAGRPVTGFEVIGEAGVAVAGVHRYVVWLAQDNRFPLKVQSFDDDGKLIETVDMADAQTEIHFPDRFFTP